MTSNAPMARRWATWMRNSLFYLRARGIPETEARATCLIHAFLEDAIDEIAAGSVRANSVRATVRRRCTEGAGA